MRMTVALAVACLTFGMAVAEESVASIKKYELSIPRQSLDHALKDLARQTGLQIARMSDRIDGDAMVGPVSGSLTPQEALTHLLETQGLSFKVVNERTIAVVKPGQEKASVLPVAPPVERVVSDVAPVEKPQRKSFWQRFRLSQAESPAVNSSGGQESGELSEIVVTAQKRAQSLTDVPMSITALDASSMEKKGVEDVLSLSFAVPGFTVREEGPGRQRLFMRGIGNNSGSDVLTSAYMDEAPINTVSSGQALNSVDMLGIRTNDLERIEVLRGPQGTLYGSGAMSGTVRFITRDPQLDRWGAKGEVKWSSTESGDSSQELTAVLNAPVVEDKFGLRLVANVGQLGGWIDQPSVSGSLIKDVNNQDVVDVRLKSLWRISDALTAKATIVVHRNDSDVGTSISDEDKVFRPGFDPTTRIPFTDNSELFNVVLTYDLPFAQLLSSSTYIDQKNRNLYGFKDSGRTLFPTYESIGDVHKSAKVFTQEVRVTSTADEPLSWIVGAFYRDRKGRQQEVDQNVFGGFEFPGFFDTKWDSEAWAAFGDMTLSLGERWEIGGGARYFKDTQGVFNYLLPGFTHRSETFDATTWRAFATYHMTERVAAYANVATGFRSGGYILDPQLNTPAFGPETLLSYELGLKGTVLNGRLTGDIAVYNSDYKDMLQRSLRLVNNTFIDVVANVGKARVKGIDASFRLQATDHLSFDVAGSFSDGEVKTVDPLNNPAGARPGDPLDYVPDYSYSIGAEYAFNWTAGAPGFVRVDYYARDKITALDRGTNANLMESDKLGFLGARIGAEIGRWSLQLFGENLTNEYGSMDPWGDWGITLRPRPRTFGISASVNFE